MADFSEFLRHIHKLEENVVFPGSGQGGLDLTGKDFDASVFGTAGTKTFDLSQFATTYDTNMFGTLNTQTFHVPQLHATSDIEAYLQSLSPKEAVRMSENRKLKTFPFSPGQPLSIFREAIPDQIPLVKFDNYQSIALDASTGATINQLLESPSFTEGMTVIVKPGVYKGPVLIHKSCVLKAQGEVYIESAGSAITVDRDAQVSMEGFSMTQGDVTCLSGTLQLTKCVVCTSLIVKGTSSVACRQVSFVNKADFNVQVYDYAKIMLSECSVTSKGVLLKQGTMSMLSCKVESVDGPAVTALGGEGRFDDCSFSDSSANVIDASGRCDLIFARAKIADSEGGHLVHVKDGAVVKLKGCELSGRCKTAVLAANNAAVLCEDMSVKKPILSVTSSVIRMRRCKPLTVHVHSGRLAMFECEINGSPTTAVVGLGSSDIEIHDSHFLNCGANGLEVVEQTTCTLCRCFFRQNRKAGAYFASVSSTVRDCVFEGNSVVGCHVAGDDVNAIFDECTFAGNLIAGCTVAGNARPRFSKSKFRVNEKFGAVVSQAKATFTGCEFSVNKAVGLEIKDGAAPTLEECVFDSNTNVACQIGGANTVTTFSQCRFEKNTRTPSVVLYDKAIVGFNSCVFTQSGPCHVEVRDEARGRFEQCQMSGAVGGVGIFSHSDSVIEVDSCTIENEEKTAIYCQGKTQTAVNNTEITGCGKCGLLFDAGSTAVVRNCKIWGNGNAGVQVVGGEVHVEACDIARHSFYGIYAESGAVATEERNTFSANDRGDVQNN